MTAFAKAVSSLCYDATDEECDSVHAVLAFTVFGLLLVVCTAVTSGAPPFVGFETF